MRDQKIEEYRKFMAAVNENQPGVKGMIVSLDKFEPDVVWIFCVYADEAAVKQMDDAVEMARVYLEGQVYTTRTSIQMPLRPVVSLGRDNLGLPTPDHPEGGPDNAQKDASVTHSSFSIMKASPGKRDAKRESLTRYIKGIEANQPNVLAMHLFFDRDQPDVYYVYDMYNGERATDTMSWSDENLKVIKDPEHTSMSFDVNGLQPVLALGREGFGIPTP